jgi:O-antigen ligase
MSLKNQRWWLLPLGLGPALAVMLIAAMATGRSSLERVLGTSVPGVAESYRVEAWSASLELCRQFPLLGTGAGSFREAFPIVQPERLVRETWHHAHNDILELMTTGGAVAILILIVGITAVVMRLMRILRHAKATEDRASAIGAAGVLSGALMHELLDFSLTIPANWVTLSVVLGAALGIWIRPDLRRRSGSVPASQSD